MAKQSNEQRYYDVLKRIARGYMTPEQIRRDCKGMGLEYEEYLEMVFENIQGEAKQAIKGRRRPPDALYIQQNPEAK